MAKLSKLLTTEAIPIRVNVIITDVSMNGLLY